MQINWVIILGIGVLFMGGLTLIFMGITLIRSWIRNDHEQYEPEVFTRVKEALVELGETKNPDLDDEVQRKFGRVTFVFSWKIEDGTTFLSLYFHQTQAELDSPKWTEDLNILWTKILEVAGEDATCFIGTGPRTFSNMSEALEFAQQNNAALAKAQQ